MDNSKVSVDFSPNKYTDEELVIVANNIVDNMTDNANFSSPSPALSEISDATSAFSAALAVAKTGGTYETAVKKEKRNILTSLLRQEGAYVQITSGGNEAKILSTGFSVNKKASPVGQLNAPESLKITAGANEGSLQLTWKVVKHASAYIIAYTETPATDTSVWIYKTITKRKFLVDELTSGKQYAFKVAGIGSDESRIWSSVINSYVL